MCGIQLQWWIEAFEKEGLDIPAQNEDTGNSC